MSEEDLNHQKETTNSKDTSITVKGNAGYLCIKRLFDIVFSLFSILLLSWLLLLILIIQLFVTKGHPLFADRRIGKDGKTIKVLKFRSMYFDGDTNIDKYLSPQQKEQWLRERKVDNDPRVTPFGRFLRISSLDELPQLFNIFIGSMSFVGERPLSEREVQDNFSEDQKAILYKIKPGLTGYWQVYGRGEADFESGKRQEMIFYYCSHRSLWLDFKLILLTFPAVLKHKGAQ